MVVYSAEAHVAVGAEGMHCLRPSGFELRPVLQGVAANRPAARTLSRGTSVKCCPPSNVRGPPHRRPRLAVGRAYMHAEPRPALYWFNVNWTHALGTKRLACLRQAGVFIGIGGWAEGLMRGAGTAAKSHPHSSLSAAPQPAIPGGLLSSRARFRFTGRLYHWHFLSWCQEVFRFVVAPGFRATVGPGFAGCSEVAVTLGSNGLRRALELIAPCHVADGAVERLGASCSLLVSLVSAGGG